jgi:hypothetical protein
MKGSQFIFIISLPIFVCVIGIDLYYNQGIFMSPSIIGDAIWFSLIPLVLYLMTRRDEIKEESLIIKGGK